MKILVINCGSSSLKYQLIDMTDESVLCKGLCERIGIEGSKITHQAHGGKWTESQGIRHAPFPTFLITCTRILRCVRDDIYF